MVDPFEVNQVFRPTKEPKSYPLDLTFTEDGDRHIRRPHDDALVVTLTLARLNVHQIPIDNESLVNVLYKQALDKI